MFVIYYMRKSSIAIYSANFGNYRNETKKGIDNIEFNKDIDYYFFTDNKSIKSNYWNVIYSNLQPKLDFISSSRHTSKYFKFVVPGILHKYDIIIWIDSSMLNGRRNKFSKEISKNKIIQLFENDKSLFFIKHPGRKTPQQELNATLRLRVEHKRNAIDFLNEIRSIKFDSALMASGCMIYTNSSDNILLLQDIYNMLMSKGLRRDQNIIQYVLLKNNYESRVSYFSFSDLYAKPGL